MENKSPVDEIKPQLERIKTRLLWAKGNKDNVFFKIEYCNAKDRNWHFAQKGSDPNGLIKVCKDIITKMCADAIQISLFVNNKPYGCEVIKITDTVIPLIDENGNSEMNPENSKDTAQQLSIYFNNLTDAIRQTGLQGANDFVLQGMQRESENQIKILQIQHDNTIQRLQDKLELVKEKVADKDNYIEILEREIEELENVLEKMEIEVSSKRLSSDKRQDFLLAAGLGKVFNMKNHEIIGLAGLLTGSEMPVPEKIEIEEEKLLSPDDVVTTGNSKRMEDIKIITNWLNEIDDNSFQYVCYILKSLAANPELYMETMAFVEGKSKSGGAAPDSERTKTPDTGELID